MSCRQVPGVSVLIGLAHIDSGLDDGQIQSLFHQIRHEYTPAVVPTTTRQVAWDQFREQTTQRITTHPGLRPQRRTGLINRISAATNAPEPDVLYAAEHIRSRSILTARLLEDHLASESARIGVPDADARDIYDRGRTNTLGGRRERATPDQRRLWAGLPLDPRTRDGLTELATQPDNPHGQLPLITDHQAPHYAQQGSVVERVGYHQGSGRLEITTTDGQLLAYRNVAPTLADELRDGQRGQGYFDQLRGDPAHQYRDAAQAAAAGIRRRCNRCGQFTGAVHNCPGRNGGTNSPLSRRTPRIITGTATPDVVRLGEGEPVVNALTLPMDQVVGAMNSTTQPIMFDCPATVGDEGATAGEVLVELDGEGGVSVDTTHLSCSCAAPGTECPHPGIVADRLRHTLEQATREWHDQQAAATQQAIASTSSTTTTHPTADTVRADIPNLSTFSYTQDPERFLHDVQAAMGQVQGNRISIPLVQPEDQPAMYGFGADRRFGLEIEYDQEYGDRNGGNVPDLLHRNQFTRSRSQMGYHYSVRQGYSDQLDGGWVLESDSSVTGGELVSPVMTDTPRTWARLAEACEIISNNGGYASPRTGAHINISAPEQAGNARRLTRFLRLAHHHQNDLFVMANAGHNRGFDYTGPFREPPAEGYRSVSYANVNRYDAVNLAHVTRSMHDTDAERSRVEFRLWDGSLEAGRMQAQVKLSAALLDYATHDRSITTSADDRAVTGPIDMTDTRRFADQTNQVRGLIDRLFRRDVDKTQATALWAAGLHAAGFRREDVTR